MEDTLTKELSHTQLNLLDDYLLFTQTFYQIKNGREFRLSQPISNESHFLTVSRALSDVFYGKTKRLYIGLPPGWGKSELCKFFVAWSFCHYPDCRFLYISYSHDLAAMHTHSIRETLKMPLMKKLFGVEIKQDTSAKHYFSTIQGGVVAAFGSKSGITGHDAGLPNLDRFSGCIIIDDIHKPDEVHSDTIRDSIERNFYETVSMRCRSPNVPIIIIGQRLHEDDLIGRVLGGSDNNEWTKLIIKGIDDLGHARYPEKDPLENLLRLKATQPYVFYSQIQQEPIPAGGALFRKEWFPILDKEPDIITTFITVDTAETDKDYSDYTAFSFWGVYQVKFNNIPIKDSYALHWIACRDIKIEVKDLESEFLDFITSCMRHNVKPNLVAVEKKSSGPTLLAALRKIPSIRVEDIARNQYSKGKRFTDIQKHIAEQRITFTKDSKHIDRVLDHMIKITENGTHKYDDICDTAYDAVKMALIDNVILLRHKIKETDYNEVAKTVMGGYQHLDQLRKMNWGI